MKNNQSGLTLIEVLGALVATSIILGSITFIMIHLHTGYDKITSREPIIQESKTIINHIVRATRNETVKAESDAAYLLKIIGIDNANTLTGNSTYYSFKPDTHTFTANITESGETRTINLSTHVQQANIQLSNGNRKLSIDITMMLPDGSTYNASTITYIPKL